MFCKWAGATVAKYYALRAMERAIELCGSAEDVATAGFSPDELQVVDLDLGPDFSVRGIVLASEVVV
jgi:hypothetical protein